MQGCGGRSNRFNNRGVKRITAGRFAKILRAAQASVGTAARSKGRSLAHNAPGYGMAMSLLHRRRLEKVGLSRHPKNDAF